MFEASLIFDRGKPSGGTIATILNILDVYSVRQIATANSPYAISPLPGPKSSNPSSWITRLFVSTEYRYILNLC